ncbi:MAG: ATP-binding cassette domain-containing protein [Halomonas sp.]|nr:ATP-binding cassette domain-containing protein [Halomonas sp.]MBP5979859.1 ATP-binding cassette domain-containing protein [Halomonas sp.]
MLILRQAGFISVPALAPIDDEIHTGELLAIVGPNGAGKSTLLRMLSGYRRCEQGTIQLDGHLLHEWEITALANRRALVAQQEPVGFDWRVEELVCLGSNPEKALIAELLDDLDLVQLAKRSVLSLSGGERQRVMIARGACQLLSRRSAVARDGGLLLLDEPTSALDIGQQQRLMRQLRTWAEQHNMAIVCVLHDLNLATTYADRVWLLQQGQRIAYGKPHHVLTSARVADVYDAEFQATTSHAGSHPLLALAR